MIVLHIKLFNNIVFHEEFWQALEQSQNKPGFKKIFSVKNDKKLLQNIDLRKEQKLILLKNTYFKNSSFFNNSTSDVKKNVFVTVSNLINIQNILNY